VTNPGGKIRVESNKCKFKKPSSYLNRWASKPVELIWLFGKRWPLSLTNKILIYKVVLKPIRMYGFAIWGCTTGIPRGVVWGFKPPQIPKF
jgi:hypothetical protein